MRFGLDIAQHQLTWDEIVHRARLAEDAGLDGVWAFDHFKALYADPMGPSLGGLDPAGRPGARDHLDPAGHAGDRHDPPSSVRAGRRGRHRRSPVERPRRVRDRRRVERAGAPRTGYPVPAGRRAHGPARRRRAGDAEAVHRGSRDVRGALPPVGGRHVPSPAGPAAAPADLDRWDGAAAHAADRGPLRRRVARVGRRRGGLPRDARHHRPRRRSSRSRPRRRSCGPRACRSARTGTRCGPPSTGWRPKGSATW